LIWPGKDPSSGVDSVGTISSALVTYAAIQSLKPDLIINAGTAGGFKVPFHPSRYSFLIYSFIHSSIFYSIGQGSYCW